MTNEITFDQLSSDIRYSQAYYSSKHHPVIVKAQNEAKTKLPYPHTRAERIKELTLQATTTKNDTYLSRFIRSYLFEAENLTDEEYRVKIDRQEKFDVYVKSEMERVSGTGNEGLLTRKEAAGKITAYVGVKVRED